MTGPAPPTCCSWLPRMETERGAEEAGEEQETKEQGWSLWDWRPQGLEPRGGFRGPCSWRIQPLLMSLCGPCVTPTSMDGAVGSEATASPPAPNLHPLTCTDTSSYQTNLLSPTAPALPSCVCESFVSFFSGVGGVIRQRRKSKKPESLDVAHSLFSP